MNTKLPSLADEIGLSRSDRRNGAKFFFFAAKVIFSAACFGYVLRQINFNESLRALATFDLRLVAFAVLVAVAQIPLLALRLRATLLAIAPKTVPLTFPSANIVTAFYSLFTQVLPSIVGEAIRAWMLTRFGYGWRTALSGVIVDRGAGVALLVALAVIILQLPSALMAFSGLHDVIFFAFSVALVVGVVTLLSAPRLAPVLGRWRYSSWMGMLLKDARYAFLGLRGPVILGASCLVHVLTIVVIWALGRAQGLELPASDCAVLFVVMVGVALIPISIGGWGLRELAVVSLLGAHGLAPERALLFSVCFGFVLMVGVLPGAIIWLFYPLPRAAANEARL